jgi:flagellar biosynthesis chaperone FliJ
MSSPLDHRIRAVAREEAEDAVRSVGAPTTTAADVQALQRQITDLHEHLHHAVTTISRLDARIDALEKATGQTDQETRPAARRTRKAGE